MHYNANSFTTDFHSHHSRVSNLQHRLTTVDTNSLYTARVSTVAGDRRCESELASLHGGKAKHAARWKTMRPT